MRHSVSHFIQKKILNDVLCICIFIKFESRVTYTYILNTYCESYPIAYQQYLMCCAVGVVPPLRVVPPCRDLLLDAGDKGASLAAVLQGLLHFCKGQFQHKSQNQCIEWWKSAQ